MQLLTLNQMQKISGGDVLNNVGFVVSRTIGAGLLGMTMSVTGSLISNTINPATDSFGILLNQSTTDFLAKSIETGALGGLTIGAFASLSVLTYGTWLFPATNNGA